MLRKLTANETFRNFSRLFGADLVSRLVGFILSIYLARTLSQHGYGTLAFVQAIFVFVGLFGDFGLGGFANREIARLGKSAERYRLRTFAGTLSATRLVLALLVFTVSALLALGFTGSIRLWSVYLFCFMAVVPQALNVEWYFLGREDFSPVSLERLLKSLLLLILVLTLVSGPGDVGTYFAGVLTVEVLASACLLILLRRKLGGLRLAFSPARMKAFLRQSLPIGLSFFLIQIYFVSDFILLGAMTNMSELGLYNAAYRIPSFLTVGLAGMIISVYAPNLTRSYHDSREDFLIWHYRFKKVLYGISLAILLIIPFAKDLIEILFGNDYLPSLVPLNILLVNSSLTFISVAYGNTVLAIGRDKAYLGVVGIGALSNILLNVALIPGYGMAGAAAATFLAELAVLAIVCRYFNKSVARSPLWRLSTGE